MSLGSVFASLGKSEAFKGALAAIGTAATAALVTKISGVPSAPQQAYAAQQAAAPAPKPAAAVPLAQQIPWTPVLLIAAAGVLGFAFMQYRKKGRGG
jgi:hypothetical protein